VNINRYFGLGYFCRSAGSGREFVANSVHPAQRVRTPTWRTM